MTMNKQKHPLVSVLMVTYNHEQFIAEAIRSVLEQTYSAWELIVIDDGSTDNTLNIAYKLAASDKEKRVKIVHQEHVGPQGLGNTYNKALKKAQGELIAILEGDDCWPFDKLESQVADFHILDDIVLSFGDYAWIDIDGNLIRTIKLAKHLPLNVLNNIPIGIASWYMAGLAYRTFTFPCTVVIKRTALEKIGGFQHIGGPIQLVDFPTFLNLSLVGRFSYHDRVLGYWRRHLKSLTTSSRKEIYDAVLSYSIRFFSRHPECLYGHNISDVYKAWDELYYQVEFLKARTHLIAEEWVDARYLFKSLMRNRKMPLVFRTAAAIGYLASILKVDLETIFYCLRGYNLRGMKKCENKLWKRRNFYG